MEHGPDTSDALQLLLDGRLLPEQRAALEAHLDGCALCRRELEALRGVKAILHESLAQPVEPPDLEARIRGALASDAASTSHPRRASRVRRAALVGLSIAAGAVLVLLLGRRGRPDFIGAVQADLVSFRTARLELQTTTSDPEVLGRFFATSGLAIAPRVFDLGMMGFRLNGGSVHRIAGRSSALFAYTGPAGESVVCQMYEGSVTELPPGFEEREHHGMRFLIYHVDAGTLVFWQEGPVVCVLAADGDAEAAIQLAYAKAVKA